MIFILNSSIMNGTITMQILSKGIEADSFKEAVNKLKTLPRFEKAKDVILLNGEFAFSIAQKPDSQLQCYCTMSDKPLEII